MDYVLADVWAASVEVVCATDARTNRREATARPNSVTALSFTGALLYKGVSDSEVIAP